MRRPPSIRQRTLLRGREDEDVRGWPWCLIDYTSSLGMACYPHPHGTDRSVPRQLCTIWGLTPSASPWGWRKTKEGSAEFLLHSWRPSPVLSLLFLWARAVQDGTSILKLGNPDSSPTSQGHNSWDIFSQEEWKPGSFGGNTKVIKAIDPKQDSETWCSGLALGLGHPRG